MKIEKAEAAKCDSRACGRGTSDWRAAGWIYSSGETMQGPKVLHDHRYAAGHYCSWNCFCAEPMQDLV